MMAFKLVSNSNGYRERSEVIDCRPVNLLADAGGVLRKRTKPRKLEAEPAISPVISTTGIDSL
jgi:hypothetical protein